MRTLIARRLAAVLPVLLVILMASFLLVDLIPGDAAQALAGDQASPEQVDSLRTQLGLNDSLVVRFGRYIDNAVHADLGSSLFTGRPVADLVNESLAPTLSLMTFAMVFAVVFGLALGMLAAIFRFGAIDRLVTAAAALATAVPPFVIGLLAIPAFALHRHWFPATGYQPLADGFDGWSRSLVLPGVALGLQSAAEVARQTRGALVDTLDKDFIRTARSIGLSDARVLLRHGLKNAGVPITTVVGLQVPRLLGSVVIVEIVFAMPGFGQLAYSAVVNQDIPVIQAVVLVSGLCVVATNLLTDVACAFLNPELR